MNGNDVNGKFEQMEREMAELRAELHAAINRPSLASRLFSRANVLLGALLAALAVGSALYAVTAPNTFSDGTVISAGEINVNFTALADQITTNETNIGALTGQVTANEAAENGTEVVFLKDVKASGANGGTFTTGAWQTRDLNTLENQFGHTWVSGPDVNNRFTLNSGFYEISALCPAYGVSGHKCRLYNYSDAVEAVPGTNRFSETASNTDTASAILGSFGIAGTTTFEIQHYSNATKTVNGFGFSTGIGSSEVFTIVKIKRLSN